MSDVVASVVVVVVVWGVGGWWGGGLGGGVVGGGGGGGGGCHICRVFAQLLGITMFAFFHWAGMYCCLPDEKKMVVNGD